MEALDDLAERMSLCWTVDDAGVPHEWHGEPTEWSRWMHQQKAPGGLCVVGRAEWPDETRVSTIFLGIDMGFGMGPGLFWELMVFGPEFDDNRPQERFASQREALARHREWRADLIERYGVPTHNEAWVPPEHRTPVSPDRVTPSVDSSV